MNRNGLLILFTHKKILVRASLDAEDRTVYDFDLGPESKLGEDLGRTIWSNHDRHEYQGIPPLASGRPLKVIKINEFPDQMPGLPADEGWTLIPFDELLSNWKHLSADSQDALSTAALTSWSPGNVASIELMWDHSMPHYRVQTDLFQLINHLHPGRHNRPSHEMVTFHFRLECGDIFTPYELHGHCKWLIEEAQEPVHCRTWQRWTRHDAFLRMVNITYNDNVGRSIGLTFSFSIKEQHGTQK